MFPNLSPGAVGIRASVEEAMKLARTNGFKGIDVDIHEPERFGAEKLKALLKENGLRIGGWGLPVDFGGSDEKFREGLKELPKWAALLPQSGCKSFISWMMSGSNEFTFAANFERMRSRFREIGLILKDHGCVFGIEFLGPKRIRDNFKYFGRAKFFTRRAEFFNTLGAQLRARHNNMRGLFFMMMHP